MGEKHGPQLAVRPSNWVSKWYIDLLLIVDIKHCKHQRLRTYDFGVQADQVPIFCPFIDASHVAVLGGMLPISSFLYCTLENS